jgi:co-chaperonin GroES (HSP10)
MCGDIELFLDPKFNPVKHRIPKGKVLAAPTTTTTPITKGDYVYFHHNIIHNQKTVMGGDYYAVFDRPSDPTVYAYENETTPFTPVYDYMFIEPMQAEEKEVAGLKITGQHKEKDIREGIIKYASVQSHEMFKTKYGIDDVIGKRVNFRRYRNYVVDVNGDDLFRMKAKDINFFYD